MPPTAAKMPPRGSKVMPLRFCGDAKRDLAKNGTVRPLLEGQYFLFYS